MTDSEKKELDEPNEDDISLAEILYWLEFGCWTTLVLFPFLRWVNGPSVSTDQFYVRTGLVVVASSGALGLRAWKLMSKQAAVKNEDGE